MRWYSLKGIPRGSKNGSGAGIRTRAEAVAFLGWSRRKAKSLAPRLRIAGIVTAWRLPINPTELTEHWRRRAFSLDNRDRVCQDAACGVLRGGRLEDLGPVGGELAVHPSVAPERSVEVGSEHGGRRPVGAIGGFLRVYNHDRERPLHFFGSVLHMGVVGCWTTECKVSQGMAGQTWLLAQAVAGRRVRDHNVSRRDHCQRFCPAGDRTTGHSRRHGVDQLGYQAGFQ